MARRKPSIIKTSKLGSNKTTASYSKVNLGSLTQTSYEKEFKKLQQDACDLKYPPPFAKLDDYWFIRTWLQCHNDVANSTGFLIAHLPQLERVCALSSSRYKISDQIEKSLSDVDLLKVLSKLLIDIEQRINIIMNALHLVSIYQNEKFAKGAKLPHVPLTESEQAEKEEQTKDENEWA